MVKEGCRVAIKMEPLRYLGGGFALVMAADGAHVRLYAPNGKGSAICSWCQSGYWVEDCSRRKMFRRARLEQDDVALGISWRGG